MSSVTRLTMDRTNVTWYEEPAMELPVCPHCGRASAVALLSRIEQGRRIAQTWICRECVSSFGDLEKWRRQIRKSELVRAGIGIAVAVGVSLSVLILRRKARSTVRSRAALRSRAPAFV